MIWTLMLVIIPIITPEYPIVWDEERELAMIIDDGEEYTNLMNCRIAGNGYKKNNTNVISYQCRAEI